MVFSGKLFIEIELLRFLNILGHDFTARDAALLGYLPRRQALVEVENNFMYPCSSKIKCKQTFFFG